MSEPENDWWANLSVIEQGAIRHHERQVDKKLAKVNQLKEERRAFRLIEQLELEIAGHIYIRQQYQNRGTQRAKLAQARGLPRWERKQGRYATPRFTKRDRKVTHMQAVG